MNTKFRSSEEISKSFQELLNFQNEEDEIQHLKQMIMFRFLSEIENLTGKCKMTKRELADKIGTSASYITQLYRGNKPLNIETVAKFQKVFNITFEIKAVSNADNSLENNYPEEQARFQEMRSRPEGFWSFKPFMPGIDDTMPACSEQELAKVLKRKSAA